MITVSSNPNPTNPTTKCRCEFVDLNCIFAVISLLKGQNSFVTYCNYVVHMVTFALQLH